MTNPERLMAAGMPAGQAVQLAGNSKAGLVGTGAGKSTAVQLIGQYNYILTCASAGVAAFQLPLAEASYDVVVENDGASPALVFPGGTTDTINALTAGASFSVTNGKRAVFYPGKNNVGTPPTGRWIVILSA